MELELVTLEFQRRQVSNNYNKLKNNNKNAGQKSHTITLAFKKVFYSPTEDFMRSAFDMIIRGNPNAELSSFQDIIETTAFGKVEMERQKQVLGQSEAQARL